MEFVESYKFKIWAIASALLFFKSHYLAFVQGYAKKNGATIKVVEDEKYFARVKQSKEGQFLQERAGYAWRNDLENIPIFLFISFAYAATSVSDNCFLIVVSLFVVGRILHTTFYLKKMQPHRTIAYFLSAAMAIWVGAAVLYHYLLT